MPKKIKVSISKEQKEKLKKKAVKLSIKKKKGESPYMKRLREKAKMRLT